MEKSKGLTANYSGKEIMDKLNSIENLITKQNGVLNTHTWLIRGLFALYIVLIGIIVKVA